MSPAGFATERHENRGFPSPLVFVSKDLLGQVTHHPSWIATSKATRHGGTDRANRLLRAAASLSQAQRRPKLLKLFCCLPMSTYHFCLKLDPFANTVSHILRVARPTVMFSIGGSSSIRVKPKMVSDCKAMCDRKLANCSGRVTAIRDIHVAGKVLSVVFPRDEYSTPLKSLLCRSGQW